MTQGHTDPLQRKLHADPDTKSRDSLWCWRRLAAELWHRRRSVAGEFWTMWIFAKIEVRPSLTKCRESLGTLRLSKNKSSTRPNGAYCWDWEKPRRSAGGAL